MIYIGHSIDYFVADRVPETLMEKWLFFIFAIFVPYLTIFQSLAEPSACSTLKNHQIWQKNSQKMKKSLAQLALTLFFG